VIEESNQESILIASVVRFRCALLPFAHWLGKNSRDSTALAVLQSEVTIESSKVTGAKSGPRNFPCHVSVIIVLDEHRVAVHLVRNAPPPSGSRLFMSGFLTGWRIARLLLARRMRKPSQNSGYVSV
jgi:hypothetical protein